MSDASDRWLLDDFMSWFDPTDTFDKPIDSYVKHRGVNGRSGGRSDGSPLMLWGTLIRQVRREVLTASGPPVGVDWDDHFLELAFAAAADGSPDALIQLAAAATRLAAEKTIAAQPDLEVAS